MSGNKRYSAIICDFTSKMDNTCPTPSPIVAIDTTAPNVSAPERTDLRNRDSLQIS